MSDRYIRVLLTVIALELLWLSLDTLVTPSECATSGHARRHHRHPP